MANQAPSARDLKSWEDAFQYPLPVIRKLEQQLRSGVNDNRDKVRALVGSGYRELLGTADRITDMNGQIHRLESVISDIGQKCNSRVISNINSNHQRLTRNLAEDRLVQRRPAAEVALLQACLTACRRLLRDDGDFLLAARLLQLARLLQISAMKSDEGKRLLKAQRLKLGALRTRLMGLIDERLSEIDLSRNQMLDLLLAHSLVTTSSLADVLRYLLRVRQQSILESSSIKKRKGIVGAMDRMIATLEQANSVFPRRMSEAMERVAGHHILQDETLRSVLEFDLNIYERWISNDIRSFAPYLRNSDLTKETLTTALKQWAQSVCSTITDGLATLLASQDSPQRISSLREKTISHLLESNTPSSELDRHGLVMKMRDMFRERLFSLADQRSQTISATISSVLSNELSSDHSIPSIWDPDTSEMDIRRGAATFRQTILARNSGQSSSLQDLSNAIATWTASIDDIHRTAKSMRQTRWPTSDEEEEDSSAYQTLLSTTDPSDLLSRLSTATTSTLSSCTTSLSSHTTSSLPAPQALFLLRILRLLPLPDLTQIQSTLHSALATALLPPSTTDNLFLSPPQTALWHAPQGLPQLPVLPSPTIVNMLRKLCTAISQAGLDILTPPAIATIRSQLAERISSAEMPEGEEGKTQVLFDAVYLRFALGEQGKGIDAVVETLREGSGVDAQGWERVESGAGRGWRRSYLLYGVLVG